MMVSCVAFYYYSSLGVYPHLSVITRFLEDHIYSMTSPLYSHFFVFLLTSCFPQWSCCH